MRGRGVSGARSSKRLQSLARSERVSLAGGAGTLVGPVSAYSWLLASVALGPPRLFRPLVPAGVTRRRPPNTLNGTGRRGGGAWAEDGSRRLRDRAGPSRRSVADLSLGTPDTCGPILRVAGRPTLRRPGRPVCPRRPSARAPTRVPSGPLSHGSHGPTHLLRLFSSGARSLRTSGSSSLDYPPCSEPISSEPLRHRVS